MTETVSEETVHSHQSDVEWFKPGSLRPFFIQFFWPSTELILSPLSLPSKEWLLIRVISLFVLAFLIEA